MKRLLFVVILTLVFIWPLAIADDYVDDVYYYPQDDVTVIESTTPSYDKNIRELIFIDEDTAVFHPDTVRAIIRTINTNSAQ